MTASLADRAAVSLAGLACGALLSAAAIKGDHPWLLVGIGLYVVVWGIALDIVRRDV